jgi:hypothetical protein
MLHDDDKKLSPAVHAIQWLADESHILNRLRCPLTPAHPVPAVRGLRRFSRHAASS